MPEGVGYIGTVNTPSTGLTINYLGNGYWGGWSGEIEITNTEADMFNFRTGTKIIKALFSFYPDYAELAGGKKAGFILELNNEVVLKSLNEAEGGGLMNGGVPGNNIRLIIAPNSKVIFKCSTNDADGIGFTCAFRGKEV